MQTYFVYMTAKDTEEARDIGRHLVSSKLAACVNILDNMNAIYEWDGELQDDREAVMIAKTTKTRVPDLIAEVKARHSYDCPCVVAMPIAEGNPDFLQWIAGNVEP